MGTRMNCATGEIEEFEVDPDEVVIPIPICVSPLQMRRALRAAGLKDGIDDFLVGAGEEAQEAWEYATEIRRDNPLVAMAAAELDKSDDELDDLFRLAATL